MAVGSRRFLATRTNTRTWTTSNYFSIGNSRRQVGRRPKRRADESPSNRCLMVHVAGWTNERAFAVPCGACRAEPAAASGVRRGGRVGHRGHACSRDTALVRRRRLLFQWPIDEGWYAGHVGELLDAGRFGFLERCVMFRSGVPLRELSVDDQTAQKIGWL